MFAYNLIWKSKETWLVYPDTKGPTDLQGEFVHTDAGTLGMTFVDIFEDEKSRRKLKLPNDKD